MGKMLDKNNIAWFECSVARYRQGRVLVRLDFAEKLLTWQDSNRWFNDFVRSVSSVQVEALKESLIQLLEANEMCKEYHTKLDEDFFWIVRVGFEDELETIWECGGIDNNDDAWIHFMHLVEKTGEQLIDPIGGH